jgi:hypothetical protein
VALLVWGGGIFVLAISRGVAMGEFRISAHIIQFLISALLKQNKKNKKIREADYSTPLFSNRSLGSVYSIVLPHPSTDVDTGPDGYTCFTLYGLSIYII